MNLPPPPSERKIARRRESTRAIRERQPQSPSPPPTSNMGKRGKTTTTGHTLNMTLTGSSSASSSRLPPAQGSSFPEVPGAARAPRPSVPHLASPPRSISQPSFGSKSVMGPPEVFVRKTRKSMASTSNLTQGDFTDEVITIPERETPMIRKNKELREAQSRRSSLGMRGQRASSSLGRGDLSECSLKYAHVGAYH